MRRRKSGGFTLVELLVVITIIGMLMGLILPAVNSAREQARRITCASNQGQVGKAVLQYEQTFGYFPGYRTWLTPLNAATPVMGSWVVSIFPFFDNTALYDTWCQTPAQLGTTNNIPNIVNRYKLLKGLLCPSNTPGSSSNSDTPLAYVANCGHTTNVNAGWTNDYIAALGIFPKNFGIFPDLCVYTNNITSNQSGATIQSWNNSIQSRKVNTEFISQRNGVTRTLMLSENIAACNNTFNNSSTQTQQTVQQNGTYVYGWANEIASANSSTAWPNAGDARCVGFMFFCQNANDINTPAAPDSTGPSTSTSTYYFGSIGHDPRYTGPYYGRPSSFHSQGGVNCVFCDGHSQFIRKDISRLVYWHLMTPDSKNAIIPTSNSATSISGAWFNGSTQFTPLSDTDFN